MSGTHDLHALRFDIRDGVYIRVLPLAAVVLAAVGCATPEAPSTASAPSAEEASSPPVFTEEAKQDLENLYLFECAPEYLPYPDGQGPPIPARSDAEWQERRKELTACGRKIARRYTKLEVVRAMAWNGTTHSLSQAEMKGIAERGPAYLEDYVDELLAGERRRARLSSTVAEEP